MRQYNRNSGDRNIINTNGLRGIDLSAASVILNDTKRISFSSDGDRIGWQFQYLTLTSAENDILFSGQDAKWPLNCADHASMFASCDTACIAPINSESDDSESLAISIVGGDQSETALT